MFQTHFEHWFVQGKGVNVLQFDRRKLTKNLVQSKFHNFRQINFVKKVLDVKSMVMNLSGNKSSSLNHFERRGYFRTEKIELFLLD